MIAMMEMLVDLLGWGCSVRSLIVFLDEGWDWMAS